MLKLDSIRPEIGGRNKDKTLVLWRDPAAPEPSEKINESQQSLCSPLPTLRIAIGRS